jgi:transposase InsO family protein
VRAIVSEAALTARIVAIHAQSGEAYGAPRIHAELRAARVRVSRKRVARIMREKRLTGAFVPKRKVTPIAYAENIIKRRFSIDAINTVWCGDITQLQTADGWLYLAVMIDMCSRRVVGWGVSAVIDTALALNALRSAVVSRCPARGLIHHTDRGAQYTAAEYQAALAVYGMRVSMSGRGKCLDNAKAESFFSSLKRELGKSRALESRDRVSAKIAGYIVRYNRERRHSGLGRMAPAAFERLPGDARARILARAEAERIARLERRIAARKRRGK